MTKAEAYVNAWRLGFKGDYSLIDKMYHPKYRATQKNINVEVDLDADKIVVSTISEYVTPGPVRVIFENDDFLLFERYFKSTLTETLAFNLGMTAVTYLDGKIITQETVAEMDLPDLSEGQDWNWEDYE